MDRRKFLQLGGAAIAAAAAPEAASAALGYERSPLEQGDVAFMEELLKKPAKLAEFRIQGTSGQARSMIRVLARWDTSASEKKEKQLHKGAMQLFDAKKQFVGQGTRLRINYIPVPGMSIERHVVVTNKHLVEAGAVAPGKATWEVHPRYDLAMCEVATDGTQEALAYDIYAQSKDATATVATIAGKDNDSGRFEVKSHVSHLSCRLSEHLVKKALNVPPVHAGKKIPIVGEEVRIAVIPVSEVIPDAKGNTKSQGMSAAGVTDVEGKLVGITSTVALVEFAEEKYGLEFIIDERFIREMVLELFKRQPKMARM